MTKAIFFDRDDTIIIDKNYLHKTEDVEFFSDTLSSLRLLQENNYDFYMVSNQSGVGRGYFKEESVWEIFDFINKHMVEIGIKPFIDLAFCPHSPSNNCECRKPKTKMLKDLSLKYRLKKENCLFVGNNLCDYDCGLNFQIKSYIINNPKLSDHPAYFSNLEKLTHAII
ncbi:HAD-IIIA family hydrolase [Bacteriovoracaceae bacterium]|nr:HAD-IIIA family hydrolase [Bacteriovoracaceae bacterium]